MEHTVKKWMKVASLSFVLCFLTISSAKAQIGSWRAFMAYYEPQQIVKAGANDLFVRASNGVYQYNLTDHSITTYDKMKQLNDTYISQIAWCQQAKRLIIVYDNANIDLLDLNGNVTNISSIYSKSTTLNKTVKDVWIYEKYAFLCLDFGAVKIDMERAEIAESYILGKGFRSVRAKDGAIYLRMEDWQVLMGDMSENLIDSHNWHITPSWPQGIFAETNDNWDEYAELVTTLSPGGPKYNHFGNMRLKDGVLYTSGGGTDVQVPATVQILRDGEWEFLQDDMTGVEGTEGTWRFVNMQSVDVDPSDPKHIFASGRTGLYEYYDGLLVKYYNKDNSMLQTATTSNKYVLINSCCYDDYGSLWLLQSQVDDNSIIEIAKDGEWKLHPQEQLMYEGKSLAQLTGLFFDSRGLLWFVNAHWDNSSFFCYNTKTDQMVHAIEDMENQDGVTFKNYVPNCITEDLEGNIWIGTQVGLFMIESERVNGSVDYVTQVKVPRNDGTNYADYLLSNVNITCIAIDAANRKWIGTKGSGLYLVSADNMVQEQNFTSGNSPLLSNNIESIAINHQSGEVFIGTEQGLCSYMGDATVASPTMVKDNVFAYPNPVVSGYDGLITVTGLSFDADVKILSVSGQLIAQGRSNGGTFTWNGRDRQGKPVASGVYMVATATSDGSKGVVCKIAVIK